MNKLLLIVLAGCTLVVQVQSLPKRKASKGQEPIGPIDWECSWDGVFPYPGACDQYVECWNNVATHWQCTNNMLFDLTYLGCNYAQYTHCEERPRPTNVPSTMNPPSSTTPSNGTTSTTPQPSSGDFDCPSDGVFAHEERCEYYWECYAGEARLIHCQSDYLFDLVYMGCNYPELTHCQDRQRPPGAKPTLYPSSTTTARSTTTKFTGPTTVYTGPSTTSTTEAPEFVCPPENGNYPNPKDCSSFYSCLGGVAFHQQCPHGLHFNPAIDACDYPQNVDCQVL